MRIWEPWETAWPAGAAALVLLLAAALGRRHLRPRQPAVAVGLFVLALFTRLLVIPALTQHAYDGHEAEFYDIFIGARAVNRGGTVLYPAMQWLWWGLGRLLPHHPWVPMALMSAVGAACAPVVAGAVARLARDGRDPALAGRVGLLAGVVVALHPVHAAWSSSAYNVALPALFGAVVLWSSAVVARSRRPPLAVALLGAAAWALVVATRLDAAPIGLTAALLALGLAAPGDSARAALRRRLPLVAPLAVGLVLGGFALFPLVFPGEVPGAGERALSFAIHLPMWAPYLPTSGGALFLVAAALLALPAARRWPAPTALLVMGLVVHHLLMATFDDLGDRHLLPSLPALAWLVAAGAGALSPARRWVAAAAAAPALAALALGLLDVRERYYASEEAFVAHLDATWPDLPRVGLAEAREGCGWINEDPRAAAEPVASHFNVLDAGEAAALRGPQGCLRWCADLQDWRWSSRGVADRARRMGRLYDLQPLAVVTDPASGYACVAWEVGARRCCDDAGPP